MKRTAISFVAFFVAAGLIWSGVSPAAGKTPETSAIERQAEETLESLRQAYLERDAERFFQHVSDRSYFNWLDFKARISRALSDYSQIDLKIWKDSALPSEGKVLLKTHWQKRMVKNSTAEVEKSEGKADFIFEAKNGVRLLDLQGDSPF